jgi:hypothetical protein
VPAQRAPLPAEAVGPDPQDLPGRRPPSWSGWWSDPAAQPDPDGRRPDAVPGGAPTPAPRPAPPVEPAGGPRPPAPVRRIAAVPAPPDEPVPSGTRPTLRRRVPQAHLAPGLRLNHPDVDVAESGPLPVVAEGLSRYQASRAAARSRVGDALDERNGR